MDLFQKLYESQIKLLTDRGYNEASLNSYEKEGSLFRQLQQNLAMSMREASRIEIGFQFEIKTVGFYNEDQDIVQFKFQYEYTPWNHDLKIQQISAKDRNRTLEMTLTDNNQLPCSAELTAKLDAQKKMYRVVALTGKERQDKELKNKIR